jgi:hypothetical protein
MSGGFFGYKQYELDTISDSIESLLLRQGKPLKDDDLYEWNKDGVYETYSPEVQQKFKIAIFLLRLSAIYSQRIDWLLSGDDDEEDFLKRLKEELCELNTKKYDKKISI